jgi:hypothetical protein
MPLLTPKLLRFRLTAPAVAPTTLLTGVLLLALAACPVLLTVTAAGNCASLDEWQKRSSADMEPWDPTVVALSKAAVYDIFTTDILVQHQYSRRGELTVLICAFEGLEGKKASQAPRAQWEIRVVFPDFPSVKRSRAIATNAPKAKIESAKRRSPTLGQVVVAAAACLSWESGREIGAPFVVRAGREADRYWALFWRLLFKPGAHTSVDLSQDLTRYRTVPGA